MGEKRYHFFCAKPSRVQFIDVGNVKFFLWQNIDYRILYTTAFYYRLDAQEQVLLIISKFKRPGIYLQYKAQAFMLLPNAFGRSTMAFEVWSHLSTSKMFYYCQFDFFIDLSIVYYFMNYTYMIWKYTFWANLKFLAISFDMK